jgi:uncharacterized protein (DUF2062 family)
VLNNYFLKMIRDPIITLLKQGITPQKIAMGLALGIVIGIFPVIGSTTLLCTAAAIIFRLNLPALQAINWLAYPLQLLLLIPFFHFGDFLFGEEPLPLSAQELVAMFRADFWGSILSLWDTTMHAIVAWLLVGPPIILMLYVIFTPLLRRLPFRGASTST